MFPAIKNPVANPDEADLAPFPSPQQSHLRDSQLPCSLNFSQKSPIRGAAWLRHVGRESSEDRHPLPLCGGHGIDAGREVVSITDSIHFGSLSAKYIDKVEVEWNSPILEWVQT
jgi:hypothetical protein